MNKLSKDYGITVKFENLPNSILGLYVDVLHKPYIIINEVLHSDMHKFMFFACQYYQSQGIGKITLSDLEKTDFSPFVYAREKLRE